MVAGLTLDLLSSLEVEVGREDTGWGVNPRLDIESCSSGISSRLYADECERPDFVCLYPEDADESPDIADPYPDNSDESPDISDPYRDDADESPDIVDPYLDDADEESDLVDPCPEDVDDKCE